VSAARISLPERYRVVRHIANGGMASVWEAHDELLARAVAVKLLGSHLSEDERARQRFQREARAAAGLSNHPNVVTIYDVGEHDGRTFMVMELLKGGTLADKLRSGDEIDPRTALRWLREAASALDAAHAADVVHRDVKPANMLLDDRGRLAIADFGIARLALEDQLTATGQVLGTAAYISPEQAVGETASAASDRYALAVVAYELLTGERPFVAENFAAQARAHVEDEPPPASERNARLPAAVDAVLARGLDKDPDARWETAGELVRRLDRALEEAPTAATHVADDPPQRTTPPPPPAEPSPGGRRSRAGALLAGLAGLIVLGVLAAVVLAGGDGGGDGANDAARQERATPTATATAEATAEATATPEETAAPEPTPETTPEPTTTPAPTATPEPTATGEPDLAAAGRLQLEGFNASQAGDYAQSLELSQQAIDACAGADRLSPCGFALYEKGFALNRLDRPQEAIAPLQERLDRFGDNEGGDVARELRRAQRRAGGS